MADPRSAALRDVRRSLLGEGLAAGVLGAAVVAIWYLLFDVVGGAPFRTFSTLGQLVLHGADEVSTGVDPSSVLVATLLHVALFALVGLALAALVHVAARELAWRMALVIGLVVGTGFAAGMLFAITPGTDGRVPSWIVIAGSALAVAAIGAFLWRRHPALARSFRDVQLGDESESPAHPPDRR
ncbi:MAG: hypothetical protein H0U85_03640 [Gemmatimonadales bacterium]|nr:hypothetical protein [Gemmatimonadales bacterium]